jgi:hypothetical protein
MQVSTRFPGAAAKRAGDDLRIRVTFVDDTLPVPLSVYFIHLVDNETGEHELRNVGLALGAELRDDEGADQTPELTAQALRRVVERYPHWVDLARAHVGSGFVDTPAGSLLRAVKRPKPARLDPEWHRMIAAEYRRHVEDGDPAPVTSIARSHDVTISAASRWVKAARQRGHLPAKGE